MVNIVSFDVPFPADYGGVIDVFYKLKKLNDQKVDVIFHTFQYGRFSSIELEKYCLEVHYYNRSKSPTNLLSKIPFIVKTRSNKELIDNLLLNDFPIIFEGLHATFFLNDSRLKNRLKIVRAHNIEHEYYKGLANAAKNIFKKFFFRLETLKLKSFENQMNNAELVWSISKKDQDYFQNTLSTEVSYLPVFHPYQDLEIDSYTGNYCLYHGNLSVVENEKAALFLVNEVFKDLKISLIVSGKNPSDDLIDAINESKNVKLIANPSEIELKSLIQKANINILPTFQSTGLKLKLLAALYLGKHCIVNSNMLAGTDLQSTCHLAEEVKDFQSQIKKLYDLDFTADDEMEREKALQPYSTQLSVQKILERLQH